VCAADQHVHRNELRATSTLQLIEFGLDLRLLVAAANLFELLIHRTMKLAIHAR
jgi:hypothetical protein